MIKIILIIMIFAVPSLVFAQGYGVLNSPRGVRGQNGGSTLGQAFTVNCDNNCIICSMSGNVMTISLSNSCGGSSGGNVVTVLGQLMMVNGNIVQILGQ